MWTARSDRQLFSPTSGWRTDKWFHITCRKSFLTNLPLGRVLLDTYSIYLQMSCSSMFSTVSLSTPLHQQQTRYLFDHSSTCSSPSTLSSSGSALENIIVCLWLPQRRTFRYQCSRPSKSHLPKVRLTFGKNSQIIPYFLYEGVPNRYGKDIKRKKIT